MSKRYGTVLFDLDGTLLNTLADLTDACNYALRACGFPERTEEEIRSFVGNGIRVTLSRAVPPGTGEETVQKAFELFTPYYLEHCRDKTVPYPGICEMLDALHQNGIRIGVVSNKSDPAVKELCKHFFPGRIEAAAGGRPGVPRKPAPDLVISVMRELDCAPSETLYAGDSEVDLLTAKNAGLPCVSVTWGFKDREFLLENGAEMLADTPDEIFSLVTAPLP